jgi:hypothetical protein
LTLGLIVITFLPIVYLATVSLSLPRDSMLPHERPLVLLLGLLAAQGCASLSCYPSPVIQLTLGNCTILSPNQTDVTSWGIEVSVQQTNKLCVVPSTVVNNSFLVTEELCGKSNLVDANNISMTDAQCRSRRGGLSSTSQLPQVKTDGLPEANPGWMELPDNAIESAADATLQLFDQTVTMIVGLITQGQQSTASHLGLASASVLLQNLKNKGLIGARSFGLDVGSQSISFPRFGSLVLGGYDKTGFAASTFAEYDISTAPLRNRHCPLQVKVTGLTLRSQVLNRTAGDKPKVQDTVIIENAGPVDFCIEP